MLDITIFTKSQEVLSIQLRKSFWLQKNKIVHVLKFMSDYEKYNPIQKNIEISEPEIDKMIKSASKY